MERGPEPISEILARLFAGHGWGRRQARLQIEDAWSQAVGEKHARDTRVISLRRQTLEVAVASGALLQELAGFRKRQLVDALQQKLGGNRVTDVRFRLGTVEETSPSSR